MHQLPESKQLQSLCTGNLTERERATLNAIEFSEFLKPIEKKDCDFYLKSAPQEIQDHITALSNPEIARHIPNIKKMFLIGSTGSGKLTLARTGMQLLGSPYIIIDAPFIVNFIVKKYQNSGAASIADIMRIAEDQKRNILIKNFDCLARENENEYSPNTVAQFCLLMDLVESKGIHLFGTTSNLKNLTDRVKDRLIGHIFQMPQSISFDDRKERLQHLIGSDIKIDSENTLLNLCRATDGFSNRELKEVIELAVDSTLKKNQATLVLTSTEFTEALKQMKNIRRLLNQEQEKWDKKDVLNIVADASRLTVNVLIAIVLIQSFFQKSG